MSDPATERSQGESPRPAADVDADAHLDDIVARLVIRFGQEIDHGTIEGATINAYHDVATDAKIRTFLPVLVERAAAARVIELLRADLGAGEHRNGSTQGA